MSENNLCTNCAYFRQHYAKDASGQLCEISNGDCTNPRIRVMPFRRCYKLKLTCERWQPITDAEPREDINDVIKQAAENIELLVKHFNI